MTIRSSFTITIMLLLTCSVAMAATGGVRIKDLGRIQGVRDNALVGYGLVSGLAGTGDSSRSQATLQSVENTLRQFGVTVSTKQLSSKNVAAVMVTASLPPFAEEGDKLDVDVSSVGDARSLAGGTLLMTPLYGPDRKIYALAQGPVSVGGYSYEMNGNLVQKNHPTSGSIPNGANVEATTSTHIYHRDGSIDLVLFDPDYITADRVAKSLNTRFTSNIAMAVDAGRVRILVPLSRRGNLVDFVAAIEDVAVQPDQRARVVVNERTGTVVSGGDVRISQVTVSQGDLRVSVVTDYLVSQPNGILYRPSPSIGTETVPQTQIDVSEGGLRSVSLPSGTTVADLILALNKIKTTTRDVISILQSMKRAGALHAELVIQ